jgi:SWI/SNF-related matrix-associated actin-dependent regulator 1 of chromatin subfamily A
LNRPSELWPLVKFIDPEGIGKNWYSFHLRYCNAKQNKYGWDVSGACNLEELNSLLCSRIMVRRRKGDVASDIPQKERVLVTFPVESPTIASILQEEKEIINKIRSYVGMGAIRHNKSVVEASYYMRGFSKINKQIAVASIPTYGAHINKILSTTNDQIVIFGRHIDFVQMMGRYLNLPENNIVHGALRVDQRSKIAESFRNGDIRVLVATIASLGVGVDLITYDRNVRVIFCEYPWQPGLLEQAEDRVCRIGQKGNVIVEYLLIEKSFFHRVFNFILNKNKTTSVISDGQQKDFKLKQKSYNLDCFIDLIKECDKFG